MAEAAAQFQKALDQLALSPATPERQRQKLEFTSDLGTALRFVRGQAALETGHAYARARELWEQMGSPSEFLRVPYGLARYHAHRGELDLALRLDEDLLRLSRQRNDSAGLVLGHLSSGRTLMLAGKFARSRVHLEEALALYDPISHSSLVRQAGVLPQMASQGFLNIVLFCLGFPEQALARSSSAIAVARPPFLAASLRGDAMILLLVGDNAALEKRADEVVAVAAEEGFPQRFAIYRGWVKVRKGDVVEGLSLLRSGLTTFYGTRAEMYMPHYTGLLAAAYEIAGQIDEAVIVLDDALQIVDRTGERWLEAELYRHKGQLLLRQGHSAAAEELYRKALSIAVEQEAKLWELRAATSLARLWGERGRRAKAHDLLAPVYGWFTEGFDTADLKEAKALLEELNG